MTALKDGSEIHRDPAGKVLEVHTPNGAVVWHSRDGVRHFELERPDGQLIVAHGKVGYIQRSFESHGAPLVQRTYIRAGITTTRFYRPWAYQEAEYHLYLRSHLYRPAFYTWAGSPFRQPVAYTWDWAGNPWSAQAAAYFQPEPAYAGPASGLDKRTYIYLKGQMKINFYQDRVTEIIRW